MDDIEPPERPQQRVETEPLERLTAQSRKRLLDFPLEEDDHLTGEEAERTAAGSGEKRNIETVEPQERKSSRLDREGSPSSSQLYTPLFAGNVEMKLQPHDDEFWAKTLIGMIWRWIWMNFLLTTGESNHRKFLNKTYSSWTMRR